ncbi:hypothetical protein [Streptomyces sp. NPDC001508]|uniref:hypothetical protein n=1 Tax=Streptomyces sp. NPDC001508 TaxID=3154656 RepID=UPI0033339E6B
MTVPAADVAVELERLRGTVTTGFAEVKGSLAVVVERTARTDEAVKQLREDMDKAVGGLRADTEAELKKRDDATEALRTDVEALKQGRWPLGQIGALVAVAGAATGAAALFLR